jgi:hypothetical protein
MPLQKLQFKPGVDRENTRYAAEGGWYETNKVRFRRGMPQKIGGWVRLSSATFLGICRSMLNWVTLQGQNLVSVGTNLKYYIERGGAYFDITPIRSTVTLTNPFDTTSGSAVVLVTDTLRTVRLRRGLCDVQWGYCGWWAYAKQRVPDQLDRRRLLQHHCRDYGFFYC